MPATTDTTVLPVIAHPLGEKAKEQIPTALSTKTEDIEHSAFTTNARLQSNPNDPLQAFGALYIGLKTEFGINHHSIFFKPFDENDENVVLHDISNTVTVRPTQDDSETQYVKVSDPTSNYSFDIVIHNYGSQKAFFKHGVITIYGKQWEWSGSCITTHYNVQVETEISNVEKPAGWDSIPEAQRGTLSTLDHIRPTADVGNGTNIRQGDDAAQVFADEILQNIMFHALDEKTINTLLPNQLKPLSTQETSILNSNIDFFKRGAVHLLAEQLKKMIDPELAKHIFLKWDYYLRMLTSTEAIPSDQVDPAVLYGFTRGKDDALIQRLQEQFRTATMACYELGYQKQCPEWSKYIVYPKYWFLEYRQMILSDNHVKRWLAHTTDVDDYSGPQIPGGKEQVNVWANKLSLLKHAAEQKGIDTADMDVKDFSETLLGKLHQHTAYSQLLDESFVKEANSLYTKMDSTKCSKDFRERFEKLNETAKTAGEALRATTPDILTTLASNSEAVSLQIRQYWSKRLPKSVTVNIEMQSFTVAQVAEAMEEVTPVAQQSFLDKVKAVDFKGLLKKTGALTLSLFKTLVKAAIHGAAIYTLYSFLHGDTSNMSKSEMGIAITSLLGEAMNLIGWVGSKIFSIPKILSWALSKGQVVKSAAAWFTNSIKAGVTLPKRLFHALLGNITKIVRIIGIIGCVFGLIAAYDGMHYKGADVYDTDAAKYRTYSTIQFTLGVIEGVALVAGVIFDIIGFAAGSMICGPLALVVGIIAAVVLIVYMIWFAPDPQKDIKDFLNGVARTFGGYDPNSTESVPEQVQLKDDKSTNDALTEIKKISVKPEDLKPMQPPRRVTLDEAQAAQSLRMWIRVLVTALRVAQNNDGLVQRLRVMLDTLDQFYVGYLFDQAYARFEQGWTTFWTSVPNLNPLIAPANQINGIIAAIRNVASAAHGFLGKIGLHFLV